MVLATVREMYNENDLINHHGPKIPINKKNGYMQTRSLFNDINLGDIAKVLGKYIINHNTYYYCKILKILFMIYCII